MCPRIQPTIRRQTRCPQTTFANLRRVIFSVHTASGIMYLFVISLVVVNYPRRGAPLDPDTVAQLPVTAPTDVTKSTSRSQQTRDCSSSHLGPPAEMDARCTAAAAGNQTQMDACRRLTCADLLRGVPDAVEVASGLRNPTGFDAADADEGRFTNCSSYRKSRGFVDAVHPDAVDFPIAFNIIAHRDARQVARLLRAIYRPNNLYCVHVDAKAASAFRDAISRVVGCFDNVRLASKLEMVTWAGYSRLQADITCMRDHLGDARDWKYVINTAGQAFPLKTVEEMVRILRVYNGANDIGGIYGKQVLRNRFRFAWHEVSETGRVVRSRRKNRAPPHGIRIVRGSAYNVFSRAFVEFAIRDEKARDFLQWSRSTWSPDELFWSTLHHTRVNPQLNAPGGYSGNPNSNSWMAVYVNWQSEPTTPCHGRYVRGVCVFGVGDLPQLVKRRQFFANKFYADYQPLALDCVEAWIRHKEQCPPTDDLEYYRQLPFVIETKLNQGDRVHSTTQSKPNHDRSFLGDSQGGSTVTTTLLNNKTS